MAQTFNKKDLRKYSEKYTNIKGAQEPSNNFKDEVIPLGADLENLPSLPHDNTGEKNK